VDLGLEGRGVQGRHKLLREQRAHDLADRVRRDDANYAELGRELRRERRLADPGRAAHQQDERDVQRLHLPPAEVVLRVAIAGHLLQDVHRERGELVACHRCAAEAEQPLLDGLGDLVGPDRG